MEHSRSDLEGGGGKTIFFHFKKEEEIMSIPEVTNDLSLKVGTDFINLLLFGSFPDLFDRFKRSNKMKKKNRIKIA